MTKSSFIKNLIRPFLSNSTRDEHEVDLEKIAAQEQKHFPFQALVAATKNFDPSHKLGEGGFGPVFKGKLGDGREVAVKKLSQRSNQGKKEFLNEAKLLSRVQHKNVVNLFGYCVHDAENLLVYEYIANQSLDKLLFKPEGRVLLDWKRRHDVITGVAKGLLYLHEEAHCSIIHRDIKASNILLDDKWVPKIADFGMARLFPEDQTHVQTRIAGTNGYMAPEYLLHGNLSKKADVFSFGVVVLELISGQKNSNFDRDLDCESLLEWDENDEGPFCSSIPTTTTKVHCFLHFAQSTLLPRKAYKLYKKGRSLEIVDPAIASSADPEQIVMYIQIGLLCVQSDPQLRPAMDRVVVILSRKPSHLEEPTRPGVPGSRYRRHRTSSGSSRTANSGGSSSGSFGTTNTQTATLTGNTSSLTGPRLDPRGKRPVKD